MSARLAGLLAALALLGGCAELFQRPPAAPASPSVPVAAASEPVAAASTPAVTVDPRFLRPSFTVLESRESVSDADVARAISDRLRRNLRLPRGSFPRQAEVTVETMLAPNGYIMSPRIARSSGYKALDEAVMDAMKRAQPLPVTRAMREQDNSQLLRLRFRPLEH